jgi:hypothetical protein
MKTVVTSFGFISHGRPFKRLFEKYIRGDFDTASVKKKFKFMIISLSKNKSWRTCETCAVEL